MNEDAAPALQCLPPSSAGREPIARRHGSHRRFQSWRRAHGVWSRAFITYRGATERAADRVRAVTAMGCGHEECGRGLAQGRRDSTGGCAGLHEAARGAHPADVHFPLAVARSRDGRKIDSIERAMLQPGNPYEEFGVEDPRITRMGNTYFLTYVAVSRHG